MPRRSSMLAVALMMAAAGGLSAPAPKSGPLAPDRATRSPENLSARQAKRQAKLARRAAKARHDAQLAEARNVG
ncbi:MAG TPA: hypothetical protein VFE72_04980 [Lysobacter sp.]|nr:hypothetical protein [Lysobacter sp.]